MLRNANLAIGPEPHWRSYQSSASDATHRKLSPESSLNAPANGSPEPKPVDQMGGIPALVGGSAFWENFASCSVFLDSDDSTADKFLCISHGAWDLTADIERKQTW
jgi:hypothetical protein